MAVHAIRSYAITALLALIVTFAAFGAARFEMQQNTQDEASAVMERNTNRIAVNTAKLERVIASQCQERNRSAAGVNAVLRVLQQAVKATDSLPTQEKIDRLVLYRASEIPIVACPPMP